MQAGDIVVFLHLPRHGAWSVARVTGGYRYEISTQGNAVDGTPDYGHIRDVELLGPRDSRHFRSWVPPAASMARPCAHGSA